MGGVGVGLPTERAEITTERVRWEPSAGLRKCHPARGTWRAGAKAPADEEYGVQRQEWLCSPCTWSADLLLSWRFRELKPSGWSSWLWMITESRRGLHVASTCLIHYAFSLQQTHTTEQMRAPQLMAQSHTLSPPQGQCTRSANTHLKFAPSNVSLRPLPCRSLTGPSCEEEFSKQPVLFSRQKYWCIQKSVSL